jgi:hypothetical protein
LLRSAGSGASEVSAERVRAAHAGRG